MSNDTGAIARQRHYTTLRCLDREVLRRTAWPETSVSAHRTGRP